MSHDYKALIRLKKATVEDRNRLAREYRKIRREPDGHAKARAIFYAQSQAGMFIAACIERQVYTGWIQ